jgi:hypothetical protein
MVVLEVIGIIFGAFSASIGFSDKLYFLLNVRLLRGDFAYQKLLVNKRLDDPVEVQNLLRIVRSFLATFDSPEYSLYGMLRRARETVRLEFKPGIIETGTNYVGINPLYGYNVKGEPTLYADKNAFHQIYRDAIKGGQQRAAFSILLVAFLTQLLGVFVRF